ncbi:hypothetical protein [Streptomyces sp. NPDC003077]|uniref:hypothetical protein n=1 Tax=Streptomyces sp. NPDC003077 TaxID=3154443 RepID=UPI0033B95B99
MQHRITRSRGRRAGVLIAAAVAAATAATAAPATAATGDHPGYGAPEEGQYQLELTHHSGVILAVDGFGTTSGYGIQFDGAVVNDKDRYWKIQEAPKPKTVDGKAVHVYQISSVPSDDMCVVPQTDNTHLWQKPCNANFKNTSQLWAFKKSQTSQGSYRIVPIDDRGRVIGPEVPSATDTWATLQGPGRLADITLTARES